jgi:hypothetical protein
MSVIDGAASVAIQMQNGKQKIKIKWAIQRTIYAGNGCCEGQ